MTPVTTLPADGQVSLEGAAERGVRLLGGGAAGGCGQGRGEVAELSFDEAAAAWWDECYRAALEAQQVRGRGAGGELGRGKGGKEGRRERSGREEERSGYVCV